MVKHQIFCTLSLIALFGVFTFGQESTFYTNGVQDFRNAVIALTNLKINTGSKTLDKATIVIKDGKILQIGQNISLAKDVIVLDYANQVAYPCFIDLYADYALPKSMNTSFSGRTFGSPAQTNNSQKGPFAWNEALKPEYNAVENISADEKGAQEFRAAGFGAVLSHRMDGILRGTGVLLSLGIDKENLLVIKDQAGVFHSFRKGSSTQDYPNSLMGSIALLRQTYLDADWYAKEGFKKEFNLSLDAWNKIQNKPLFFEASEKFDIFRIDKIAKEFNKKYIIKGNGDEYQRVEEIKKLNTALIIPIAFPDAYDVEDPYKSNIVTLGQMKHWEAAPFNPAILAKNGINFAFTSQGLKEKNMFLPALRKAIKYGLTEEQALKGLTEIPAKMIGVYDQLGSLEVGKLAHFFISNQNIFDEKAKVMEVWLGNKQYTHQVKDVELQATGAYLLTAGNQSFECLIKSKNNTPELILKLDTIEWKGKIKLDKNDVQLTIPIAKDSDQTYRLSGKPTVNGYQGFGYDPKGNWVSWNATLSNKIDSLLTHDIKKNAAKDSLVSPKMTFPYGAYGWSEKPKQGVFLVKNATLWTNESQGILQESDLLIENGKISAIGKGLNAPNALVIDAKGKHLSSGIIDEHSHIAISRGVNEGTQSSSAEVRIGDVLNSDDVNIYRQLAGGVTAAQLLHGSANPVGGQSAIIKLRWGVLPEEMKIEGAKPYIKFALGENVKQSNWGDNAVTRFPQTRMGVEQWYMDYFTRATEYGQNLKSNPTQRRDLDLEAGLEILQKKRFITCHSYVQSEINMLMKVADKFNFKVNTFTHILEGYKVADKMAAHGVGAASFADWWMYKFEVAEAIPHNAGILSKEKVVTAINSDDAEMARRLNQEAAKSIMYTGMSEEDAWKMVTLNPAKLLQLDHRMGSLKVGKDADIVLWSANPLSIYARAEKTWVDGILYYDQAEEKIQNEAIATERNRIIQKMIKEKQGGQATQAAKAPVKRHYHCDDIECEVE